MLIRFFATLSLMAAVYVSFQTQSTLKLSAEELRGRDIYFGAETSQPAIKAVYGNPAVELPATMLGCASCHGSDGKGKSGSEVQPKDITWEVLTKGTKPDFRGKVRPAYTEQSLVRAVCMGIDSAGDDLQVVMPRFQISREDMKALIAYLKRLPLENRPTEER